MKFKIADEIQDYFVYNCGRWNEKQPTSTPSLLLLQSLTPYLFLLHQLPLTLLLPLLPFHLYSLYLVRYVGMWNEGTPLGPTDNSDLIFSASVLY